MSCILDAGKADFSSRYRSDMNILFSSLGSASRTYVRYTVSNPKAIPDFRSLGPWIDDSDAAILKVPRVAGGERGAPGVGHGRYHRVELRYGKA